MNNFSNQVTTNFLELVSIDSPSGQESVLAKYLISRLSKSGWNFQMDSRGNIFARNTVPGIPVLISAHLDTVEPGKNIHPLVEDGNIVSDGTTILGADNKAALAAIITVLESTNSNLIRPLEIIFSVEEETNSGIKDFDFNWIKSKTGLIADRSAQIGEIVLSAPTINNLNISIIGKGGHASAPEAGVNALTVAAKAINETVWGRIDPDTTSNIGLIEGGSAMNSIPENVKLIGEIRSFDQNSLQKTIDQIRSKFDSVCNSYSAKLDFSSSQYCQGYNHDKNDSSVIEIINIFNKLNINPILQKVYGASDANAFNAHNIKVVTISDGCQNAHTVRESITVANLNLLTQIFQNYITRSN